MKQNNTGRKLKAIVAVVLVMAALFAMSSLVNAGIVELILGEEYEAVAAASSSSVVPNCSAVSKDDMCSKHPYIKTGCTWSGCTCGGHVSVSWGCSECQRYG